MEVELAFRRVVEHIFNNWTALKLAVEHSMGGPDGAKTALECLDYMTKYCLYEPNVEESAIQEALDDIMDQEFDTVCEDLSTKEIAAILYKFVTILQGGQGGEALYSEEFDKLPKCEQWLIKSDKARGDCSRSMDVEMDHQDQEQDSEWTQVTRRKHK